MADRGPFHDTAVEKLNPAALEALQTQKLGGLLALVAGSNKFYKAKFKAAGIKTGELSKLTLGDLPFTLKTELAADQQKFPPFGSNLSFPFNDYCRYHQTSGSTGTTIRWLDTPESWEWMLKSWSF